MFDTSAREYFKNLIENFAKTTKLTSLHPNFVTLLGLLCGLIAFFSLCVGKVYLTIFFLCLSAFFDILDGTVARLTNKTSKFGAYFDLISDKLVECLILVGFYFYMPHFVVTYFVTLIVLIFNFSTVSLKNSLFYEKNPMQIQYDFSNFERNSCFFAYISMILFPKYMFIPLNVLNIFLILLAVARILKLIIVDLSYEKNDE